MKKLIYILIVLLFGKYTKAQTFTVGSTCCNYNLVNYNLTINCPLQPFVSYVDSNSYFIDVTGDLNNDIAITATCAIQGGGTSSYNYRILKITSNNGVEFVYGASGAACWWNPIISNLPYGTPLVSTLNWSVTPSAYWDGSNAQSPAIYYYWWKASAGITINCGIQTNPFYIGFRKILPSTDTIYGWIRMDGNFPGKVIDYAYTCGTYTGTPATSTIITTPASICSGDSLLLSANPTGGVFFGTGVSGNYFKAKNLAAGVYTVSYAIPNPSGCSISPASVVFTVNPTNTVTINVISSALPSCKGQTVALIANGATTYTWSNGVISPSIAISPTASIVYTVNATSSLACTSGKATFTQTVIQPTFAVSASNPTVCPGTTTQLNANGASSYSWSTGSVGSSCTINPTVTTTYSVVATFSPGCIGADFFTQVVSVPVLNANISPDSICSGSQISLNTSGANTYVWSNGCNSANCTDIPLTTTTYTVIGYGYGNCSDTAYLSVYVNSSNLVLSAVSNQSIICAGDTAILTLSGATGYVVQGGTEYYTTTLPTVAIGPQSTTTYYIYGNYSIGGCIATGVYTQSVSACVGIHEIDNFNSTISIYPNPANDKLNINIHEFNITNQYKFKLVSVEGKELKSGALMNSQTEIDVSDLSTGFYFVEIGLEKTLIRRKLVVTRQ